MGGENNEAQAQGVAQWKRGDCPVIDAIPSLRGLTDDEQATLAKLWQQWLRKQPKNMLLDVYYDTKRAFQDLGISIPPQMSKTSAALGWPSKAVQALARKHVFEGYTLSGSMDPFEMGDLLEENLFEIELVQAISSAYKHSCSFLTVTKGGEGEPDVLIQARDAEWSTAIWDKRRREISSALAITDTDDLGNPTAATMFLRDDTIHLRADRGAWSMERLGNLTGRVLVEPLTYDPQLNRPFGHSRITREVRYLTDAAVRTLVRTETSAEFFSSPQRWAMGVDEEAFKNTDRWTAIMGRLLALEVNEEGNAPTVGQFPQLSMDPHLSMYRQLAQNFCAATGLPQSSVGLFTDNPASAEAMQAAEVNLSDEADYQWRIFRGPLRRVLQDVMMVRDNLTEPPVESWKLGVKWTPTRYVSPQAASDSIVKIVQAIPKVADTTVALRRANFTTEEIEEMQAEWKAARGSDLLDRAMGRVQQSQEVTTSGVSGADGGVPAGE